MGALREIVMNKADRVAMEAHDISRVPKDVYYYKSFRYERLDDAVRYARIDAERDRKIDAG
jgi:hypothetical protein